mmetsp:Transcript_25610/g.86048  ORF Transcript_25610/g.86048 Transcript_25610/m.86048 type:complete len:100 (-) Transcript_25610:1511-1810(-)
MAGCAKSSRRGADAGVGFDGDIASITTGRSSSQLGAGADLGAVPSANGADAGLDAGVDAGDGVFISVVDEARRMCRVERRNAASRGDGSGAGAAPLASA